MPELYEEIRETIKLDEVPPESRPACPTCLMTMRRDLGDGRWTCDLHGEEVPVWVARTAEVDEDPYID